MLIWHKWEEKPFDFDYEKSKSIKASIDNWEKGRDLIVNKIIYLELESNQSKVIKEMELVIIKLGKVCECSDCGTVSTM